MVGFVNMPMQLNTVGCVHPTQSMVLISIQQVLIGLYQKQKLHTGSVAVKTKTHIHKRFVFHHKLTTMNKIL